MVRSEATDVDEYLALAAPDRVEVLTALRRLCRTELTGYREKMAYGMPAYTRDGVVEIAFAAQKRHLAIYLMRPDVREAFAARLAGHDVGKGCLRFRTPRDVDLDLVGDLLRATAATHGTAC
ncbi:uncharacterized protein YdhG (YjbR/CyaY superfamily) [Stackebrandtia albiflava]|uniref:Uncharacterized protein YdhG (YjbR/CyaY superfamily) n=1 Tax=Stackebrandtia albiflava TaxID=406432 RepID=A0A562VDF3_9ACTN|nr:DUF1801 domain-containing protein [Stackebrandtia albiflava]TWJ15916.1 uncharacterized protein YdhG (YjbR/CyaY superfamily) [Stackebrandtia albiflava]